MARNRGLGECLARVRVATKQADRLEAHHRLSAALIEAASDSSVDVCIGPVSVADECIREVCLIVRVTACEAKSRSHARVGAVKRSTPRLAKLVPPANCAAPLVPMERNGVGRGVLRRSETGRERERQAERQAGLEHSGLQVRARRLTIHRSNQTASLPMYHCEATRPASSSPTITLATALLRGAGSPSARPASRRAAPHSRATATPRASRSSFPRERAK